MTCRSRGSAESRIFLTLFAQGASSAVRDSVRPTNLLSSPQWAGERRVKDTDHPGIHCVVHLANRGSEKDSRDLESAKRSNWARRGAVLGWNDPAFFAPARPKSFSGSFQST
jgi:hypothetical protein